MGTKCGAKLRNGGRCGQAAGHRTDHPGSGACWLHGGRSQFKGGPLNPNYKHGLNARFKSAEEWEAFCEWRKRGGIKSADVPEELEYLIFRCLNRLVDNADLRPEVEADVINKLTDALLKAQKYRGAETPQKVAVSGAVPLPVFSNEDAVNHFANPEGGADDCST